MYQAGELPSVVDIAVEPEYGYISRVTYQDGSHRIIRGNDLGLNPSTSRDMAADKGHTKFLLRNIGVECPQGEEFLLPWWAETIRPRQNAKGNTALRMADEAGAYVEQKLDYPVYVKPVSGSLGHNVYRVESPEELASAMKTYDVLGVRVAIVEEEIKMPDYRVVVFDGELVSANRRIPLSVTGDGRSSVLALLTEVQEGFDRDGRNVRIDSDDPRLLSYLAKQDIGLDDVVPAETAVRLLPISNLSAGGRSEDVTHQIDERWSDLAAFVANSFGLRLCGVDIACADITDPDAPYSVLEVNSTPGLGHFAAEGDTQRRVADDLYRRALDTSPIAYMRRAVRGGDVTG